MNRLSMRKVVLPGLILSALSGCCGGPCKLFHRNPPPPRPPVVMAPVYVPQPGYAPPPGYLPPAVPAQIPSASAPTLPQVRAQGGYTPSIPDDPLVWRGAPAQPQQPSAQAYLQGPQPLPEQRAEAPKPLTDTPPRSQVQLYPPDFAEPPIAPREMPRVEGENKPKEKEAAADALPLDIPQYALARTNVSNGLKPFPQGFDWLKRQGYRTVLNVTAPGEDDSAARRLIEKVGLKYERLELSPRTLDKATLDKFNSLVTDQTNLPLFVYDDKNLSLTGTLWYLHYRIYVGMDDTQARDEAARLGFKADQEENRTLLIAAQTLLQNLKAEK